MTPGTTLKRWRAIRGGMSQQDLAVLVGGHVAAVSQWERGIYTPKRETAQRLDDAMEAGGEILLAFGYLPESADPLALSSLGGSESGSPSLDARLGSIDERIAQLARDLAEATVRVTAILSELADRLPAPSVEPVVEPAPRARLS